MKADYKNWVPKYMVNGLIAGTIVFAVLFVIFGVIGLGLSEVLRWIIFAALLIALIGIGMFLKWSVMAYKAFSYDGTRQLSKQIIEGTANYINIPNGGKCLDVGCGSGALTIACAKRNPKAEIVGLDRWGKEYSNFSNMLCCKNAKAEGVSNVKFVKGSVPQANGKNGAHAWCEIKFGKTRYVYDPNFAYSFRNNPKAHSGYKFKYGTKGTYRYNKEKTRISF